MAQCRVEVDAVKSTLELNRGKPRENLVVLPNQRTA